MCDLLVELGSLSFKNYHVERKTISCGYIVLITFIDLREVLLANDME